MEGTNFGKSVLQLLPEKPAAAGHEVNDAIDRPPKVDHGELFDTVNWESFRRLT